MAPTYSNGQEMVSIYLIKIKITTKFFKSISLQDGLAQERKRVCLSDLDIPAEGVLVAGVRIAGMFPRASAIVSKVLVLGCLRKFFQS